MPVTVVHPAKAVGQNEMPFGRDILVVPGNTVLDRGSGLPTARGDLGIGNYCSQRCRQSIAKLLYPCHCFVTVGKCNPDKISKKNNMSSPQ